MLPPAFRTSHALAACSCGLGASGSADGGACATQRQLEQQASVSALKHRKFAAPRLALERENARNRDRSNTVYRSNLMRSARYNRSSLHFGLMNLVFLL